MARGFVSGLVWGGVVCTGMTAVVSLVTPLPSGPTVQVTGPEVAVQPQVATETDAPAQPVTAPAPDVQLENAPTAPVSEAVPELDNAVDTVAAPEVGGAGAMPAPPPEPGTAPQVTAGAEPAPQPTVPAAAPDTPVAEADLSISTDPSLPAPEAMDTTSGFIAPSEGNLETFQKPAPESTVPEIGHDMAEAQSAPVEAVSEAAPVMQPTAPAPQAQVEPEPQTAPQVQAELQPMPAPEAEPAPEQQAIPEPTPAAPRVTVMVPAQDESDTGPTIGTRVVPLTERASANSTRLPAVGQNSASAEPVPVAAPADTDTRPPLERFAAPFDNPEGKPLFSIVLIDAPGSLGAEALSSFPYPLTFAVDPEDPQAAEKAARHRAAGFEVALLVDLPEAATPQDAEAALGLWQDVLPETVALVEGTDGGFQGNRPLSDQVTDIAGGEGRGLVTQGNGLNTVQKLALRDGVPSAPVFRDFDGAGQTPTVMRRFLDQAAFRAGQDGAVVMMGRVRPDTISALLLWGLQDRAERVRLAPLSAVLQGSIAQ